MKHSELENYLTDPQSAKLQLFSEDEVMDLGPEPLLSVYIMIKGAIRRLSLIIEVTKSETIFRKKLDGSVVERRPNPIDFRSYFEMVRKRDVMIRSHLKLVKKSSTSLVYQIIL